MAEAGYEQGSFGGVGGVAIHWRAWLPDGPARAVVLIAHGAAEHSGRYDWVAGQLVARGLAVLALDHRGHGRSGGPRAYVDRVDNAVADLHSLARLAAFIVSRTGRAEDFFLPGLLLNAGYALAYLVSILVGWPLLGVIVGAVTGQGMSWRRDPEQVRAYARASWIWVAMFVLRLIVQLPLYLAGAVVALGVARVAMGAPLFAVAAWLSWLILRPPPQPRAATAD